MPAWASYLIGLGIVILLSPLLAMVGTRYGARAKGLAMIMIGFGSMFDPPKRHMIEAMEQEEDQAPKPGDPPLDDEEDQPAAASE